MGGIIRNMPNTTFRQISSTSERHAKIRGPDNKIIIKFYRY